MEIKVLGSGCSKCHSTIGIIERTARAKGIKVDIIKVESADAIKRYDVQATPAVVIDGRVVHSGGLPSHEQVDAWLNPITIGFLTHPTRHLFFTGKGALGLSVLNIDPDNAAESYRQRVLAQMGAGASADERATVREQLSGACTTEIASFDGFSALLSDGAATYDHIVFDTAPTGHTLRLLSLPKAWTGFLGGNDRGASCLGPHSGLKMQEVRFKAALDALSDPAKTTVILVTRPDQGAINEAAHTARELHELGLNKQRLAVNGVFHASDRSDAVACAIEDLGQQALDALPASLRALPQDRVPLRAFDTVGLPALRALLTTGAGPVAATTTSMAVALALGLVQRGQAVHLSTTDPAAHLAGTLNGDVPGLTVSRIDPKVETQHYIDKIMAAKSPKLDLAEQALLLEDLQSPCSPTSTPRCATASWAPATHRWPIRLCRPCRRCPTSACCCPATSSFARRPRIVSWSASSTRRSR